MLIVSMSLLISANQWTQVETHYSSCALSSLGVETNVLLDLKYTLILSSYKVVYYYFILYYIYLSFCNHKKCFELKQLNMKMISFSLREVQILPLVDTSQALYAQNTDAKYVIKVCFFLILRIFLLFIVRPACLLIIE